MISAELSLPVVDPPPSPRSPASSKSQAIPTIALVGNPNAGKTSLFNRLTGLRAQTANFAGTTVERRHGSLVDRRADCDPISARLVDLPGLYSLDAVTPDERVTKAALDGKLGAEPTPDALLLVVDSTNLERNLFLAGQVLELEKPTVVALNMSDVVQKHGVDIDIKALSERLGCPVVEVSARTGQGIDALVATLAEAMATPTVPVFQAPSGCGSCNGCAYSARYDWAESVGRSAINGSAQVPTHVSDALDSVLAHKVFGLAAFAGVMLATFALIFWLAQFPMELIDGMFSLVSVTVGQWLPEGDLRSLISDGLIGGVGGMLVFLPQIMILFFVLTLLEDSGYLSRAAFVMDRLMCRVGLPGKAFVPLLSAHACAIPAIMSTRVIDDRRDRLATILVAPLMTCSARVPVYAMVVAMLFRNSPIAAAAVFAGAYAVGIVAALVVAWVLKKTILPGETKPLVIELPNYRRPSLRNAFTQMLDRSWMFIRTAGTTILLISLGMWALATYPKTDLADLPAATQAQIASLEAAGDEAAAENLLSQAQLQHSFAGKLGAIAEPVFAPLGMDWKMSVGVVSSFAAREVIVSTLAVLYGLGEEEDAGSIYTAMRESKRADGTPVFTVATCLSLLVFYILAMQCLPTQAVTKRETGTWKWPLFQLGYMSLLAYVAAFVTYQSAVALGWG